jgi:hypothetical protein
MARDAAGRWRRPSIQDGARPCTGCGAHCRRCRDPGHPIPDKAGRYNPTGPARLPQRMGHLGHPFRLSSMEKPEPRPTDARRIWMTVSGRITPFLRKCAREGNPRGYGHPRQNYYPSPTGQKAALPRNFSRPDTLPQQVFSLTSMGGHGRSPFPTRNYASSWYASKGLTDIPSAG